MVLAFLMLHLQVQAELQQLKLQQEYQQLQQQLKAQQALAQQLDLQAKAKDNKTQTPQVGPASNMPRYQTFGLGCLLRNAVLMWVLGVFSR